MHVQDEHQNKPTGYTASGTLAGDARVPLAGPFARKARGTLAGKKLKSQKKIPGRIDLPGLVHTSSANFKSKIFES